MWPRFTRSHAKTSFDGLIGWPVCLESRRILKQASPIHIPKTVSPPTQFHRVWRSRDAAARRHRAKRLSAGRLLPTRLGRLVPYRAFSDGGFGLPPLEHCRLIRDNGHLSSAMNLFCESLSWALLAKRIHCRRSLPRLGPRCSSSPGPAIQPHARAGAVQVLAA
jgi:hypothetical protein